jgi:hypothetical protein
MKTPSQIPVRCFLLAAALSAFSCAGPGDSSLTEGDPNEFLAPAPANGDANPSDPMGYDAAAWERQEGAARERARSSDQDFMDRMAY